MSKQLDYVIYILSSALTTGDYISKDPFCSVINKLSVKNSEPCQTMMMSWATFSESEKVSELLWEI
jgi:hypothetical protein